MGQVIWTPAPYGRDWTLERGGDALRGPSHEVRTFAGRKGALAAARNRVTPPEPTVTERDRWLALHGPEIIDVLEMATPLVGAVSPDVPRDMAKLDALREIVTRYIRQIELREINL